MAGRQAPRPADVGADRRSKAAPWRSGSPISTTNWPRAAFNSGRTSGSRTNGSRPMACRGSRFLLPRTPAAGPPRARADARGRGRNALLVHAILRHEVGHAIDNVPAATTPPPSGDVRIVVHRYPEFYTPKPYSRSFVLHIDNWYAQSHPDEDFAETFAVWLNPALGVAPPGPGLARPQEARIHGRADAADREPATAVDKRRTVDPLHRIRRTLRQHYKRKAEHYALDYPDFYDRDLRRLFRSAGRCAHGAGLALHQPDSQGRAPHRRRLDRAFTNTDRSGARRDGRALRRAASSASRPAPRTEPGPTSSSC